MADLWIDQRRVGACIVKSLPPRTDVWQVSRHDGYVQVALSVRMSESDWDEVLAFAMEEVG